MQINLNGIEYKLAPMAGDRLLEWAEINVLAAAQKALAHRAVTEEGVDGLREALRLLLIGQLALCCSALQCSGDVASALTLPQQNEVISQQERLNQTHLLTQHLPIEQMAERVARG